MITKQFFFLNEIMEDWAFENMEILFRSILQQKELKSLSLEQDIFQKFIKSTHFISKFK